MYPATKLNFPNRQRGAALVVSLVMMVILTLIGVVSMNSSSIELIMAGNTQLETRAQANAERTLATAESIAEGLTNLTTYAEAGIFSVENESSGVLQNVRGMTWSSSNSEQADTEYNRYVIEHVLNRRVDGNSEGWGTRGYAESRSEVRQIFRITTRSEGAKGAVRMIQSVFVAPLRTS